MSNVIVTAMLIIGSVTGAVIVITAILPSMGTSSQTVVEAQRAGAERERTALQVLGVAAADDCTINAWVKNTGATTIEGIDRSDVFLVRQDGSRFDALNYSSTGGAKTWSGDLKELGVAWEPNTTVQMNLKRATGDVAATGDYKLVMASPLGVTVEKPFYYSPNRSVFPLTC